MNANIFTETSQDIGKSTKYFTKNRKMNHGVEPPNPRWRSWPLHAELRQHFTENRKMNHRTNEMAKANTAHLHATVPISAKLSQFYKTTFF
jgi:hypothetical protein